MNNNLAFLIFFVLLLISSGCNSDEPEINTTVTDFDGNVYPTVLIGNQVWMAENLRTTHYSNGDLLSDGTGLGVNFGDDTTKYYFWPEDNLVNKDIFGALYTWAAVMNGATSSNSRPSNIQGVCPVGWHLPSDAEWKELETFLGISEAELDLDGSEFRGIDAGGKLKQSGTSNWKHPNNRASNESGFEALPSGWRFYNGTFFSLSESADFWTATQGPDIYSVDCCAFNRRLHHSIGGIQRSGANFKEYGMSVRCIKN